MAMGAWLAILALAAGPGELPAGGTDSTELEKICAATGCRAGGYDAAVGVDKDRYTTVPVTHSPYLPDKESALVFPGETIAIRFSVDGDKPVPVSVTRYAPRYPAMIVKSDAAPVANADDAALPAMKGDSLSGTIPPNLLIVSYGQFKPQGETGMVLTIESSLPHKLKLDAIIAEIAPGSYKQHYTSTCAIQPKLTDFENWPNALGPIVLTNFRFLADDATMSCE